jgi:hypothetical protein
MKIFASLLAIATVVALAGWELLWRMEHSPTGITVPSPDGAFFAQERSLPEGAVRPYGQAVFVRRAGLPFWAASKMVFAGYCKPEVGLAWPAARQLRIGCIVAEGSVVTFAAPSGVTVVHDGGA